jgi:uncharacterized membrane protein
MLFSIAGLLIAGLGVPLWLRRVPPNRLYGVRTAATLADESRWYAVNASAGRSMVAVGIATAVLSVALDGLGVVGDAHVSTMALVVIAGGAFVTVVGLKQAREHRGDR